MNDFSGLLELVLKSQGFNQNPQDVILLFSLAFARYAAFINTVPFLGGAAVPARIKMGFAASLVLISFPVLLSETQTPHQIGTVGLFFLLIKEYFVGFTLGFAAKAVFEAIQCAGRIIDVQRGAAMAELLAQPVQEKVSEMGLLKLQLSIVIFFAAGFHRFFLNALLLSFEYLPATKFINLQTVSMAHIDFFVNLLGQIFAVAIQLALPVIVVMLLTDLFFGLLNRIAPQANVFFLSMPVKTMVGILVVLVMLSLMVERYKFYFFEEAKIFEMLIKVLLPIN